MNSGAEAMVCPRCFRGIKEEEERKPGRNLEMYHIFVKMEEVGQAVCIKGCWQALGLKLWLEELKS